MYDNTRKTSGGPWIVTIARNGSGTTVPEDTEIIINLHNVTNQQFEGTSGTFPMFKTALSDGITAIDESSPESDAIGIVPPAVTFTPSAFTYGTPSVVPESSVAGDSTGLRLTFVVQNPLPNDAKIIVDVPGTFTDTAGASSVSITSGINGGFNVVQQALGPVSVFDNTLKTTGGPWRLTLERDSTGERVWVGSRRAKRRRLRPF